MQNVHALMHLEGVAILATVATHFPGILAEATEFQASTAFADVAGSKKKGGPSDHGSRRDRAWQQIPGRVGA